MRSEGWGDFSPHTQTTDQEAHDFFTSTVEDQTWPSTRTASHESEEEGGGGGKRWRRRGERRWINQFYWNNRYRNPQVAEKIRVILHVPFLTIRHIYVM